MSDKSEASDDDMLRFELMAGHVRDVAGVMLTEHFGDRCPDYEETCESCRRWKLLDQLTVRP